MQSIKIIDKVILKNEESHKEFQKQKEDTNDSDEEANNSDIKQQYD